MVLGIALRERSEVEQLSRGLRKAGRDPDEALLQSVRALGAEVVVPLIAMAVERGAA